MDDKTPAINLVIYLIANVVKIGKQKAFYLGGHGYTYDCDVEGKKKLAKDVPTTNGYYTGNPQKPNTVVTVGDIVNMAVPNGISYVDVLIKGLLEVLKLVNANNYQKVLIVTPHKEAEELLKIKTLLLTKGYKFGDVPLKDQEVSGLEELLTQHDIVKNKPGCKLLWDFSGSAEGGAGNRDAQRQLDLAEVISVWGFDKLPTVTIQSRKDYENPDIGFNKIVSASRWYFDTHQPDKFKELIRGFRSYSFGTVEPDKNYYGKLTPDVTYSKLYTKEPIELLDKLFDYAVKRISNKDGFLTAGDIRQLVSKDIARLIDVVPALPDKNQLVHPYVKQNGRSVLIELIKPVMMSYRIREFLVSMDIVLESFFKRVDNVFGHLTYYDITDLIYVKEVNGKGVTKLKINPDFNQLKTVFKVPVKHRNSVKPVPITLSIGYDIPNRNAFNSVTDPEVKVWVITDTRNEHGIRYSTMVTTEDWIYAHTSAIANLRVLSVDELGRTA